MTSIVSWAPIHLTSTAYDMISACCGGFPPMNATCDEECASRPSLPAFVSFSHAPSRARPRMDAPSDVPHAQRPPLPQRRQARSKRTKGRWAPTQRARRFMAIISVHPVRWTTSAARRPLISVRATRLPEHPRRHSSRLGLGRLAVHHGHHRRALLSLDPPPS